MLLHWEFSKCSFNHSIYRKILSTAIKNTFSLFKNVIEIRLLMTWKQVFKKHWERQAAQSSPIVTLYIVIYIGRRDTRLHNVVGGFALWWKLRRFDLWKINVPPESESPNQNELLLDLSAFSQYDIEICSKIFVFFAYNRWLSHGLLGWGKKASLEL